jgi:hypothetical protein
MTEIITYQSILTLNVNGLNYLVKRHHFTNWIKNEDPTICCLQETHLIDRNKHMKKCSPSLAIKEMQINITLKFHFTSVRIAIIKNRCWQGCGKKGAFIHCWWECKLVQSLWKTIWRLLKNLNIDLPYDPAIPLLGIYPKECNSGFPEALAHPCLLQHYSQYPSYGNSQDVPLMMNGLRKCGIYIQWSFTQP